MKKKNNEKNFDSLENGNKYNFVLNNLKCIVYEIDLTTLLPITLDGPVEFITGYTHEEFISGKASWKEIIHPSDLKVVIQEQKKLLTVNDYVADTEYRIVNKNGEVRWIRDVARMIVNEKYGKQLLQGTVYNINQQKNAEEELLQTKLAVDNSRDAILWVNPNGAIEYANKSACDLLEYSPTEILKLFIYDFDINYPKEIWDDHWEKTQSLGNFKIESEFKSKSGKKIPVEISVATMVFKNKEFRVGFIRDITEVKQATEILEKNRQLLYDAQRIAHIGSWEMDLKTNELIWSEETFNIFGFENRNFQPTINTVIDFIAAEDKEKIVPQLRDIREASEFKDFQFRITKPNGTISWLKTTGQVFTDFNGIPNKIIGTIQDITEQTLIEQELRCSEEKFSKAFHTSPDSININRLTDGVYVDINDGFTSLTGFEKEEVIGKSSYDINIWANISDRAILTKELLKNGEVNNLEAEFRLKDGRIKTGLMSARIIEIKGEQCILSITRDISERKKAMDLLRESEERFHTMFENNGAVMLLIEPETGKIIDANKAASEFYGYSLQELCSMTSAELNIMGEQKIKSIRQFAAEGSSNQFILQHKLASGEVKTVEAYSSPIVVKDKKYILGIIQDISERIENETALIEAKTRAESSERFKSAFLAQMSHEIRSPLYRILGYVSLIKDSINFETLTYPGEVKDYFGGIELSSKRLVRTIDSILNMSELQTQSYSPEFSMIDIFSILRQLHKEYYLQAEDKNLSFYITRSTDNSRVNCDEYSTTQIFANLIDNALKYTEHGEVEVTVGRTEFNQLYIDVRDTGIGISDEFMAQLFSPFTQEEVGYTRKFDGNGLGLALVKSYCHINNATVDATSKKGEGTTFRVVFQNN